MRSKLTKIKKHTIHLPKYFINKYIIYLGKYIIFILMAEEVEVGNVSFWSFSVNDKHFYAGAHAHGCQTQTRK